MKIATLFSGGGILDCAIREFGLEVDLAVECDPERLELSGAIADCYEFNLGKHLIRQPVQSVLWHHYLDEWFLIHASPSCKNFSNANLDGMEDEGDVAAAEGVARAIQTLRPQYFTLEEVRGYLHTVSFAIIRRTLEALGYSITYDVLNSFYYGVPQERERLIMTCCRNGTPVGLPPMQQPVGWGEVLGERIDSMKESKPTPAQKAALEAARLLYPDAPAFLVQRRGNRSALAVRQIWQPTPVITCAVFTDGKGANRKSFMDIWHDNKWYTLGIHDMAALQTIPDWYALPESTRVAGAIIGNGVPTAMYKAVLEQIQRHFQRQ